MKDENKILLLVTFVIAAVGVALFGVFAMWWGLNLSVQPQTVANVLAPLILTAAFIERAVEVVITPWRDTEAKRLRAIYIQKIAEQAAADVQQKTRQDLNLYRGKTTWYAFIVAFMFSLVAAMVGIRSLWPFLDAQNMAIFNNAPLGQQNTFIVLDVVLSALLMAGGANGIHSPMNAFTSFFDASAQKSRNSVNS